MHSKSVPLLPAVLLLSAALVACGDDDDDHDHDPEVDAGIDAAPATVDVNVAFAARINGTAFACGVSIANVGSTNATYIADDFRFYVHDIALIPAGGGTPVPVTLTPSNFQTADGIALLDFENGAASCQMGSTATNTAIVGTAPFGRYGGITFKLGIPFARNHLDPATAMPPFTEPGMSWAWQFGYKFLKADGTVAGEPFNLHIGSTGCPGDNFEQPPTGPCVNPNVPTITLTSFDPENDKIVADLGNVLAGEDVSINTVKTAPGCMSFPGDPECDTIFSKLGLPFDTVEAGPQTLFHVE